MGIHPLNRAVFFDRDGVLTANTLNPANGQWESPHVSSDFRLLPGVIEAVKQLNNGGYHLFLVSNQPSYAKGKASLENIRAIADILKQVMLEANIVFDAYYYCLHHPEGVVLNYSGSCRCRKPSPFFLHEAEKDYGINLKASWMIGDRTTDMECGRAAGTRTIFICSPHQDGAQSTDADFVADHLPQAAAIILSSP